MPREPWVTSSKPNGSNSASISRSFPTLLLAMTTGFIARPSGCSSAVQRLHLQRKQLPDAIGGQIQHGVELVATKSMTFRRALNLDKGAAVVHDHVHIGFRVRVLGIV